ncbi:hypothetical protein D9758_000977 [Tetrapyrgos nigripes]|uniref:Uncharacterized protein n=1 Tax=Tetrapyrgos nigripes TaxID=182062 RepID=A0A8H5LYA0_9AGAR|nr:hypothetical protein D9758_000977 [Tetrapyrgos nigripes]
MRPRQFPISLTIFFAQNLLLLVFLSDVFVAARVHAVNRTIDDTTGDLVTGVRPIFLPVTEAWQTAESCAVEGVGEACVLRPDETLAFDGTWTAATHKSGEEDRSIILQFHGTAIYVYFILPTDGALPFVTESNFILDDSPAGYFYLKPSTVSNSEYLYHENALVFSKTGLTNNDHTLVISTAGLDHDVFINFDYAVYTTETEEADEGETIFTSSRNPALLSAKFKRQTATADTPQVDTSRSSDAGAIIGAVTGILVVLGAAGAGLVYYLRRQRKLRAARTRGRLSYAIRSDERYSWSNGYTDSTQSYLPKWSSRTPSTMKGNHNSIHSSEASKAMYSVDYPSVSQFNLDFDDEMTKKGVNYDDSSLVSPSTSSALISHASVDGNNPISMPAPATTSSSTTPAHGRSLSMSLTSKQEKRRSRRLLPALPGTKEPEEAMHNVEAEVREWQNGSIDRRASLKSIVRHIPNDSWGSVATLVDDDQVAKPDGKDELDKMDLLDHSTAYVKKHRISLSMHEKRVSSLVDSLGKRGSKNFSQFGHQYPPVTIPVNLTLTDTLVNQDFMLEDPFAKLPYQHQPGVAGKKGKDNRYTFQAFDGAVSVQMLMSNLLAPKKKSRGKSIGSVKSLNEIFRNSHDGNNDSRLSSRKSWGGKSLRTDKTMSPLEKEFRAHRKMFRDCPEYQAQPSRRAYKTKAQRRADRRMMSIEASIHRRILIDDCIVHPTRRPRLHRLTLNGSRHFEDALTPISPAWMSHILSRRSRLSIISDRTARHVSLNDPLQLVQLHSQFMSISSALQLIGWTLELLFRHRKIAYTGYLSGAIEVVKRVKASRTDVTIYVLKFLMKSLMHTSQQAVTAGSLQHEDGRVSQVFRQVRWYNTVIRNMI